MFDYDDLISTAKMELADAYSNLKSTARWASDDQRFQLFILQALCGIGNTLLARELRERELFKYELVDVRDGE